MMALDDIRILDLSRLAPGPFCTMLLGDLGADVLLIEPPSDSKAGQGAGFGAGTEAYNALGRNKRSIVLNLREDDARDVFYKLVESADVVLEGFRPGVVKRLGVDYETLKEKNPRIVYCSLSGYGQTGPYSGLVGHDINYISVGGALGMIGWPDQPPAIPMNIVADFAGGGLHAAYGILAALHARDRTGKGQFVDIAMSDGVLYLLASAVSTLMMTGRVAERGAFALNGALPQYNVYECSDGGWISLGSLEGHFWVNLCNAMEREDFIPYQMDGSKRDEVFAHFREKFKTKTRDEWFEILKQTDICVAPVYSLDEALEDPHNVAREMVIELEHPQAGKVKQVGIGTKLSETPGAVRSTTPVPGQHTDEVLADLGFDSEAISAMREGGIVA
ncbi:MAG: CoA transferase [Chloroflexi bacterium]|nr:CoA transferase [Chloroflexota bacterium]